MSGDLTIDLSGLDLDVLSERAEQLAPTALDAGMEHVHQVAAELTPIETGRLVGSAHVEVDGDEASITFAGPYARYQHERLDLRHEHGQAKYLEQPLNTERRTVLAIIAQTLRAGL